MERRGGEGRREEGGGEDGGREKGREQRRIGLQTLKSIEKE